MTTTAEPQTTTQPESRPFEADVSRLLHLMVHAVYSDKDVFLRELISNAADACERLRYEAIAKPELLADDAKPKITIRLDAEAKTLTVEDNGIGMSRDEMVEALGTIAKSGTKAFMDKLEATKGGTESATLIGQFGVGFYSAFMVADKVDVVSRRAGDDAKPWRWSSDGKGSFTVEPADAGDAPTRGTRVLLHLTDESKDYTERYKVERIVKDNSGHVPVPISIVEKPGDEASELADGAALWTKPRSEIKPEDYAAFYKSIGNFDEPALTIHFRAEGRHEFTTLAFVPTARPFDLYDNERKGRLKLYVRRVFITDDAEILPRYLRFVRGLVDSYDLPLSLSREMIQQSPILAAIKKSVTNRVVSDLEKLADSDAEAYQKIWDVFGPVLKEGIYEDFERREQLLKLARFRTTSSAESRRSLKDYVAAMKPGQDTIYYIAGDDLTHIENSPHLEGFRARGIEIILLSDMVDSLWAGTFPTFEGKRFKSVTQGAADLASVPLTDDKAEPKPETTEDVTNFIAFVKLTLGDAVDDVRASDRLTDSAVCLVASEGGMDRSLEKLLQGSGRIVNATKPVLEINPRNTLVAALAGLGDGEQSFKEDAAHLLYDEARVLEGDKPVDPKRFSERLARLMTRGLTPA